MRKIYNRLLWLGKWYARIAVILPFCAAGLFVINTVNVVTGLLHVQFHILRPVFWSVSVAFGLFGVAFLLLMLFRRHKLLQEKANSLTVPE